MSWIKLAVYGALGYLVYQMFFSDHDVPLTSSKTPKRGRGSPSANRGPTITGGGTGRTEKTEEPSGTSVSHRVGRGVI